jgi:serine-type D-Ala-D-Ala endopeptidase (penicillin-binding protein 7)
MTLLAWQAQHTTRSTANTAIGAIAASTPISLRTSAFFIRIFTLLIGLSIVLGGLVSPSTAEAKPAQKRSKKLAHGKVAKAKRGAKMVKVKYVKNRAGKLVKVRTIVYAAPIRPAAPTFGQLAGLHSVSDPLDLKSSVALVMDQQTNEVLFSKNAEAVLPIASITKLMTAMVVLDGRQNLDDSLEITDAERDTEKNTRSRLSIGTTLTRADMLHLALMSSENRAAHTLGRSYPGGVEAFVRAMNAKAAVLGMGDSRFADPTGLSNSNRSSARDLAKLVQAAHAYPIIRRYSTDTDAQVSNSTGRLLNFNNTNRLVKSGDWQIGLQKTGFISEAGQCLVMQAQVAGRSVIMVFLDSFGKLSRIGDAARVRRWLEGSGNAIVPVTLNNAPAKALITANAVKARA